MYRLAEYLSTRDRVCLLRRMSSTLQRNPGSASSSRVCTSGYKALSTFDHVQTYRQQHQLDSPNHLHREAMRLFLDSLNFALTKPSSQISVPVHKPASPQTPNKRKLKEDRETIAASARLEENSASSIRLAEEKREEANSKREVKKVASRSSESIDLNIPLGRAIRRKDMRRSMSIFESALESCQLVDTKIVISLFYLVSKRHPMKAYNILQYYNTHPETADMKIDMYRRLCSSVALLDPKTARHSQLRAFIETLLTELDSMEEEEKQEVYPTLVASLVSQRSVGIGPFAGIIYNYMIINEFDMASGWLNKLLSASKYNRQEDLPFDDVLARLVSKGEIPHPLSTLPVIHNMFPYTNSSQMSVVLQALLDIYSKCQEEGNEANAALYQEYSIDLATLEMISAGAAKAGDPELILLVWEVLEMTGFKPTEQIYENTVVAFACTKDGLFQAFAALATMKDEGFEVSRAVIRSFSRAIRSKRRHVDNAFRLLTTEDSEDLQCLENFNVVMSSYAERGDVNETLGILDIISQHGLTPNQDSYSFAMEVLGKDLHRRKSTKDKAWVHKNIELASTLLTMMEKECIAPSADVVRNYVELLCMGNELGTATALIEDCLSTDKMTSIINNKTLYRVALSNAEAGNIDKAKELAARTSETIPVLHRKIRSKEQRFDHLESMRKIRERDSWSLAIDKD